MPATTRIGVFGAGSWGTALAAHLARNGHRVRLWGRDPAHLDAINQRREHPRYLPGIALPDSLIADGDLARVADCDLALVVVPSHAFADLLRTLAPLLPRSAGFSWATKGFEPGSGRFLHEVAEELLPKGTPLAVVTGPSFAREVALQKPTAVTVHGDDESFATEVARVLHGPTLRAYSGDDMAGAELGGAMKNVLAVATGIADGMQLGLNARAGLITRGLNEMLRLNTCIGGRPETIIGLAGLGDLVLTCTGDLSRNRRLGLALGAGKSIDDAVREIGQVVESIQTCNEVRRLAERHALDLPIAFAVHEVLHGHLTPHDGLARLLAREQKPEW